jgi:hypothetical protein
MHREVHPARQRRSTWLSRAVVPERAHNARRVPHHRAARGKDSELEHNGSCPCVVYGCRIRHRTPPARRAAQAKRRGSEGVANPSSVARPTRGAVSSEKGSRVERRRLGSWQAVSFTRGGGSGLDPTNTTQADLRWRKRDSVGDGMSETKSRALSEIPPSCAPVRMLEIASTSVHEGEHPSSSQRGPSKRIQCVVKRRILRSSPFSPNGNKSGREPRARVQVRQVVVGRSRSDTSRGSREIVSF